MPMALRYAARSHVGLVRDSNQDSGYAGPHLLVVADGMGGHAGGDVASSTAIGALAPLDDDSHGSRALQHLEDAIGTANGHLHQIAQEKPELAGMGTTVTALLRTDNKLAVAHIGDSRAYLLRQGQLIRMTHDHTFVQSLVDEGRITAEDAEHHPHRSMVTRVLTGHEGDEPDVSWRELHHGDRYLICSDGVSGFVAQDTITEILAEQPGPDEAADRLVDLALRAGGQDNITAIVADVVRLTDEEGPSTRPQVVGAAAARQLNRSVPDTPAARAAALTRTATGAPDQEPVAAEDPAAGGRGTITRLVLSGLLALVVLAGLGYAGWLWSQQQWFVAAKDDKVAVYRGIDQQVGPLSLSTVDQVTDVSLADLPDFYRNRITQGVPAAGRDKAQEVVADMRNQAQACTRAKAAGQTCGDGSAAPTTTPTPTPTVGADGSGGTATVTVVVPPTPAAPGKAPGATPTGAPR
ncbi:Stp1/IreP family PP2C-type Ser/Thr phosphatase [Arsenicicoccus dermatophilus]|uniref:Stp1/IreP family PP2C-type Ser/Thr phosphatase n=1 Tax=Arsenicicoccus dermatophilus TaxID=1076331 RepID=UPI003916EA2F